jgi:outer membrane receptor protein involved in Fe transport
MRPGSLLLALCLLPLVHSSAAAQNSTGELRIVVRDQSGAAVAASGVLENLASGAASVFQMDSQGRAIVRDLAFGRYHLHVSRAGFATESAAVELLSSVPVERTFTLALSAPAFALEVVATTPLPGVERPLYEIPAPVQAATGRDLEQSGALDLADFLNRRIGGVYLNELQGNPVQPDLNYRGFTASPLLGTPQGISIYMDGVRLNQPFGDVVSWDLIPRIAISEITVIPGSNPLFGLNTLGGALSLETKDGRSAAGSGLELSGGSFGRKTAAFEHGGSSARAWSWYTAGNLLFEDGWRPSTPSNVRQFFGSIGWQGTRTVVGFSAAYANNSLMATGLGEQRMLARDYSSVYTLPDLTANRSPFLNLRLRHTPNARLSLAGNLYYRYLDTRTTNGDLNEDSLDQAVYQPNAAERAALAAAGYTGFPTSGENAVNTPFPSWRCIAQALLGDEPSEKCNGLLNRSLSRQHNYGASGQVSWFGGTRGIRHQFTAGTAYDRNRVDYSQLTQLGYLNPARSVVGVPAFADGVSGGDQDGEPYDLRVDLHSGVRTASVFATDTLSPGGAWTVVLSGRYNRTTLDNRDRLLPEGPGSLTGRHVFARFNPAAGVTFRASSRFSVYGGYGEGSRAPTSIELGCADPERPCKLPNAMTGDPPLQQVVARTFEAGVRGGGERLRWSGGWFRADNRNDILFVASGQTGFGYFKNFGGTLRQGFEAASSGRLWRINAGAGYTFLNATFESAETVGGSGNSSNDVAAAGLRGVDGTIGIAPGDRMPLTPRHSAKAWADVEVTPRLLVDAGAVAVSGSLARGNENNLHRPDGVYYLGPGTSPGYAVLNAGARYAVSRHVELFVRVNNLLNRRYYTGAQLGSTGFTGEGTFVARPFPAVNGEYPLQHATFYAAGAPRGAWGGIRLRF